MEKLITLKQAPYLVLQARLDDGHWSITSDEEPAQFSSEIIRLDEDGKSSITLTEPQIEKLLEEFRSFKEKVIREWEFPVAQCCGRAHPRGGLKICYDHNDCLAITCKLGFGCRAAGGG